MKRTLATAALTLLLGAPAILAFDPAAVQTTLTTRYCFTCDLSGADLAGADLPGVYLVYSNLTGANLARANLSGGFMLTVVLQDADLTDANLANANLEARPSAARISPMPS